MIWFRILGILNILLFWLNEVWSILMVICKCWLWKLKVIGMYIRLVDDNCFCVNVLLSCVINVVNWFICVIFIINYCYYIVRLMW